MDYEPLRPPSPRQASRKAPTWLLRINIGLGIATVVLTAAIVELKGEAWANWLKKQPFNKDDSDRTPYSTERALMLDLGEALAELEAK